MTATPLCGGDLLVGAVAAGPEQEVGLVVVALEDVEPAIAVEIQHSDPHALGLGCEETRFPGHVAESSILLEIEEAGLSPVLLWLRHLPLPARHQQIGVEGQEVADHQIQIAVAVGVEPGAADTPLDKAVERGRSDEAGGSRHIPKGAVAVVVKEAIRAVVGDKQIDKTIVVEVAGRCRHAPQSIAETRAVGAVGKAAAAVAEEPVDGLVVSPTLGIADPLEVDTVEQVEVEVSVPVVVEPEGPRAARLQNVVVRPVAKGVAKVDPQSLAHFGET